MYSLSFIQEKYKIAKELHGSGNNTNITFFAANKIRPLDNGEGNFAENSKELFHDYWRNYGKTVIDRDT